MKKIVLVLTFMAISSLTFSQTYYIANMQGMTTPRWEFGPKAGLNISGMIRRPAGVGNRFRYGFNAGGFLAYRFHSGFALQTEVMYSQQGVRSYRRLPAFRQLKLDYVNIPLLAKFYPVEKFYIELGPQLAINVYAREKNWVTGRTTNISAQMNDLAVDAVVGIGYDMNCGFIMGARYNVGLTSVEKKVVNQPRFFQGNNHFVSLWVGWRF